VIGRLARDIGDIQMTPTFPRLPVHCGGRGRAGPGRPARRVAGAQHPTTGPTSTVRTLQVAPTCRGCGSAGGRWGC